MASIRAPSFYAFPTLGVRSRSLRPCLREIRSVHALALWERDRVRVDRQPKEKPASLAEFAFQPNLAAVHLHELLCQRKPQAGALRFSGVSTRLLKFEEDPFLIFRRNSWSR